MSRPRQRPNGTTSGVAKRRIGFRPLPESER